jgi:hypothetical protein
LTQVFKKSYNNPFNREKMLSVFSTPSILWTSTILVGDRKAFTICQRCLHVEKTDYRNLKDINK